MGIDHSNAQTAISTRSESPSLTLRLKQLLALLAEARQTSISAEAYKIYSSHLAQYRLDDIEAAIRKLMLTRRNEGETAFPDLATLNEQVRTIQNRRLGAEREQRERDKSEAQERDRHEHPENYIDCGPNMANFFAEFLAKRRML